MKASKVSPLLCYLVYHTLANCSLQSHTVAVFCEKFVINSIKTDQFCNNINACVMLISAQYAIIKLIVSYITYVLTHVRRYGCVNLRT